MLPAVNNLQGMEGSLGHLVRRKADYDYYKNELGKLRMLTLYPNLNPPFPPPSNPPAARKSYAATPFTFIQGLYLSPVEISLVQCLA
jgi:hypothetical protein